MARRRTLQCWLLAALVPPAFAQPRPPAYAPASAAERSRPMPEAQRLERRFLQLASLHLHYQLDAARIVLPRTTTASVRELANEFIARRESPAGLELLRLLHVRGMAPPMYAAEHYKVLKALPRLQGAKLDRFFVEEVAVKATQADIPNYERALQLAEDPALKAWVERQLPALRARLAKAQRVVPQGVTGRGASKA